MSSRRLVRVVYTAELFRHLAHADRPGLYHRVDRGIPLGAKRVGAGYDFERDSFYLVFEHESFPEVPEGEAIPPYFPVFSAICLTSPVRPEVLAALEGVVAHQFAIAEPLPPNENPPCPNPPSPTCQAGLTTPTSTPAS